MLDPLDRFPGRLLAPSPGDRLLDNAAGLRLDLLRVRDDDGRTVVSAAFRLEGCLDLAADAASKDLLLGIIRALGAERPEGDAA